VPPCTAWNRRTSWPGPSAEGSDEEVVRQGDPHLGGQVE
jgi:hypothetical protein